MAESSLSKTYDNYLAEVGIFLGYGPSPTGDKLTDCQRHIDGGLANFYNIHKWSFLHKIGMLTIGNDTATGTVSGLPVYSSTSDRSTVTATTSVFNQWMIGESFTFDTSEESYTIAGYTSDTVIELDGDASSELSGDTFSVAADAAYDLPDDFGSLENDCFYFSPNEHYERVIHRSLDFVLSYRAVYVTKSRPVYCAIRPKASDLSDGQRMEVIFDPSPDTRYDLLYPYRVLQSQIRTGQYPLGGERHAETIKEFILCEAELMRDRTPGVHHSRLYGSGNMPGLLRQSIQWDNDLQPSELGPMEGGEEHMEGPRMDRHRDVDNRIIFYGTT